jgi:hypothetical protein
MAGYEELDKFVKKFLSLWEAGCEASLHVETRAGNAVVNLQVGLGILGQAKPGHGVGPVGASGDGCRGGSPSRQRRRQKREADRVEKLAAAEEVEEKVEKVDQETFTEEIDGIEEKLLKESKSSEGMLEYELRIDAHADCKNYDVMEAIEVNFDGILNDMKVNKDDVCRYIHVQKDLDPKEDNQKCEDDRKLLSYRVLIKDSENSKAVVESWKKRHNFDDLAFHRAVYDKINIRITEVQRL